MKIEVKRIDNTKREISIEVVGEVVKNKFEGVFKKISQEAKVPGFRPGNIPRDILEKRFSSYAHEQVLKELVPDIYNQAINAEKLDVVQLPEISDVKLDRASLSFKAKVDVSPEINLKNYKGLKVKYGRIEVSPDEIKRSLNALKESRKIEIIDDKFCRGLGYSSVAEMEKAIERQAYIQKENQERQGIENELLQNLTKDMDFKIPKPMVERQLQELVRRAKVDLALKGVPREKIDEQEKELLKNLEPEAREQVKVYLVLSEIAKKENIPVDDDMPRKVMEFLLREADWSVSE